jgi:hypothetical protein
VGVNALAERHDKTFFYIIITLVILFFLCGPSFAAQEEEDPLLGVREGWAWPVVVIQPPEGWESPRGNSIKFAMRTAEREISKVREAIGGKEVTFMFSNLSDDAELQNRLSTWRTMKVAAIVSFAEPELNEALALLCREKGPSLLLPGGENFKLFKENTRIPYQYLFALDLPDYARANALAEAASIEYPSKEVAVITDILSDKLARGAELNIRFLQARGLEVLDLSVAAYRQDQFSPQVREAESEGIKLYTCWLDAMATLSIWQSLTRRHNGSTVYFSGKEQQILTDAEGLILVDKDVLLDRDEQGKHAIINKIRDEYDVIVDDPVTAARAYAMAKWVIGAYVRVGSEETEKIVRALEQIEGIPLMGELISIDLDTHRPVSRKFGLLRVTDRIYESAGSVEVFSRETVE